ncbi:MAG: HEPN domain-containing protein [Sedimentisphaerales bacterium]|nr:HEPN domain-containing protein [Sedimentisphaerales bacterium]MCK5269807.1 HEPN domain-containing protein [Sedimentisphaerales bacterium]
MNNDIRETILQWRAKALSDWTTVEILLESEQCPADTVCFHCQQYIEKLTIMK